MKSIFTIVLVLTVIGAIFYGGYYAIDSLWLLYSELESVVRIVLLSSMAVVLVGSFIVAGAIKTMAFANNKGRLMEAKLNLYKSLVALYEQYVSNEKQPSQKEKTEILTSLKKLESEMLILASSSVLSIHGKLETELHDQQGREKLVSLFQQLIKSIRRDLGHGKNYDETKLKFLINSEKLENNQQPDPDVSH